MKEKLLIKKGNAVITMPFVVIISLALISVFTIFSINTITPFIWYQKLQLASYKYMYIVEKYGCLKNEEKENLINDLVEQGFEKKNISIEVPSHPQGYGKLIDFNIYYNYKQKLPSIKGSFNMITKTIPINVNKTIISKV